MTLTVTAADERFYRAQDTLDFLLAHGGTARVWGSTVTVPVERRFGDLDGVRRYLAALRATSWGHPDTPAPQVRCRAGAVNVAHWQAPDIIALPVGRGPDGRQMLREHIVVHEYAHHVTWHQHGATGHGPVFQDIYLDLLEHAIGAEAAFILRAALHPDT